MNLELQKCEANDKSGIWSLFVDSMKSHIEKIWGWDIEWQKNEFNGRYIELNTSFILFNGERIGYVQYRLFDTETYVNMIILYPDYRGHGFGIHVLMLIKSIQDVRVLSLRCFKTNKDAYRFYLRNGFEVLKEEENSYLLRWGA